jgi:hypothetical protein
VVEREGGGSDGEGRRKEREEGEGGRGEKKGKEREGGSRRGVESKGEKMGMRSDAECKES